MKSLQTNRPPAAAQPEETSQNAREEALDEILKYAMWVTGGCAIINLQVWGGAGNALKAFPFYFNALLFLGFIGLSTQSQLSFRLRSILLIVLLYAAAALAFLTFGPFGSGNAFLLAFAVVAAIFFGIRAGAIATGIAIATAAVTAYVLLKPDAMVLMPIAYQGTFAEWVSIGGNLIVVFVTLILPQRHLWESQAFVLAISKQKQELLDTRAALQKQTHQMEMASAELAGANMQLQEQSHTLERRAQQLAAAAEIGRAATSTFDLPALLETSVNLIRDRFGFYHTSVFIIEPGSDMVELRESTGEAGRQLKARKHKLAVGSKSLVGAATATHQPVIVQDVTADPNYYPNPLLPDTRAEAVLPLLRGDTVIGAVDVQSALPNSFAESDLAILSTIVDQLAVAVQNSRLYTETQAALAENAALFKVSAAFAEANSPQDILDAIAKNTLPRGATRASLIYIHYNSAGEPTDLEVRGYYDTEGKFQRTGLRIPAASTPLITRLGFTPLTIADIYNSPEMDPVTLETLSRLEIIAACFVPLRIGGRLIGNLLISAGQPTEFNAKEIALVRSITDQIVVSMEKLRLLEETRRRAEQSAAAADIGRAATSTFDLPTLLETTVNLVRDRFGFYHASVFIVEPGSNVAELRESTGEAGRKLKERKHKLAIGSKSLVGSATATRQPVIVQDVRADPNYYPNPLLPDTRAEAVLPMLSGDAVVGAIDVQSTMPGAFVESEIAILTTIVGQLATAVQNARLYAETQARLNELATLNQISRAISSSIDIDLVFNAVRDQLGAAMGVENIYLGLYDEEHDQISFPFMVERGQLVPLEARSPSGRTHYIIHTRQPLLVQGDAEQIAAQLQQLGIATTGVAKSYLGVPLMLGDRIIGVLAVQDFDRPHAFDPNHQRILTTVADQLAVAIQNARLYTETQDRLGELATLNQLSRAFSSTIDVEQIYQTVREQVATVMNVTDIYLALYNEEQDQIAFPFIIEEGREIILEPSAPVGLTGHIIRTRERLLLQGSAAEVQQQMEKLGAVITYGGTPKSYFGVPLIAGQRVIGVLAVQHLNLANTFDGNHQRILSTIADQLAVTIQNARLYKETQDRLGELATLNQLSRAFSSTIDVEQIYRTVREQVAAVMNVTDIYLALYNEERDEIAFPFIIDNGQEIKVEPSAPIGLTGHIIRTRERLLLQGSAPEMQRQMEELGAVITTPHVDKSYFGVPLLLGQRIIGVLAVEAMGRLHAFTLNQQRIMTTIADQLAVTIQNARLYAETQRRLKEVATLNQLSRAFSSTLDIEKVYQIVREQIAIVMGTGDIYLALYDEERNIITFPFAVERGQQLLVEPRAPNGLTGCIISTQEPVNVQGTMEQVKAHLRELGAVVTDAGVAPSYFGVPLIIGHRVIGALAVQDFERFNAFDVNSQRILITIADQLAVAVQNARLFAQTQAALSENATLFKISRAMSEVDTVPGILEVVSAHAMPQGTTRAALIWVDYNEQGEAVEIDVRGFLDQGGQYQHQGLHIPAAAVPIIIHRLTPEPLAVADVRTNPEIDPVTRETLLKLEMAAACFVPLFIGGRLAGIITLTANQPTEFSPRDISVLRGVADLVTVTLEKLQLLEETRRRAEQLAAAAEIGRAATASFDLPSVLETTVNLIRERFGFYHASIFTIEPGANIAELRESTGEAGRQLKARKHKLAVGSKSLVGAATANRKPVVVQDVRADPNYYPNPLLPDTRAEAVIPLLAGDTVVGAMDVQSTIRGAFGAGDMAVLSTIAGQLAVAVQNARLYDRTAKWANRERMANQITTKIRAASAGDIDSMLRTAVTELRQALGVTHGIVQLNPKPGNGEKTPSPGDLGT